MGEEDIPEKKLERLTGTKDLSTAIEKLERKKEAIEDDFKDQTHVFFENLNPITLLDKTLQNVKKSSSSKYALFKETLAFGAGYLSKRKLIHQLKGALINTFRIHVKPTAYTVATNDNEEEEKQDKSQQTKKKMK